MNKEFVLKANLIEHGIRISRNAKDTLINNQVFGG